jgi:hypothetical protein
VHGRPFPAVVKVTTSEVRIEFPHKTKTVTAAEISGFVPRTAACGELVTASGKSYLIAVNDSKAPFQKLKRFSINCKWTSTFDHLLFLNRVSGRSFHDPNCFEVRAGDWSIGKSDSEIVAIAASSPFQMVVFVTAVCQMHLHSVRKGNETMPPCQFDAFIDSILITEKWGFVLLHSTETLYLYNLNGTEIKKVPITAPFLKWTTFSNVFGFDYVAAANAKGEIIFFEAFYPENATVVGRAADVVCIAFDDSSQRIIVVTAEAAFTAIPCPICQSP